MSTYAMNGKYSRQLDRRKCQATFRVRSTVIPTASHETNAHGRDVTLSQRFVQRIPNGRVIRHEELVRKRVSLEALCAVPGHVVKRCEGPVCQDEEVQVAVADEDVVCALDDAGEDGKGRGKGAFQAEGWVAADGVVDVGFDVEGFLDVGLAND